MKKRGQTIFVVVALLIIAAVILLFYLYAQGLILPLSEEGSKAILSSQVEPLRSFVENCVEDSVVNTLNFLGEHAGYADYSESGLKAINFAGEKVVVLVKARNGFVNRLPSKAQFEEQFSLYINDGIDESLDTCIKDFTSLKAQGLSVAPDKRTVTASIKGSSVDVDVDWPVTLRKGRARLQVEQQDIRILMDVDTALRVANDIVNTEFNGIAFEGLQIDTYIARNPFTMQELSLTSQNYPTAQQKIFLLITKQSEPQEREFRFYFAIDRAG